MDDIAKLTRGMSVVKWVLLSFNMIVLLGALFLIGFGGAALGHAVPGFFSDSIAAGIIVIGVLVLLLSFLGVWGSLRENRKVLIAYFSLVIFFVVIEFALGIAAIVLRNELPALLNPLWTVVQTTDDQAILTIENAFQCCGYTNVNDRAVPPYITTVPHTPTCMNLYSENGFPTRVSGCYVAIYQSIIVYNNVTAAAYLQADHTCCGYYAVNDPLPFGVLISSNGTQTNCTVANPTWPSCVSALQTQFYSTRNAALTGNLSAVNDAFVIDEQNEFGCCGWLNGTDAAVPPYYNQTCIGLHPTYTQGCQQAVVTVLAQQSAAVAGGVAIAIAVIQIVAIILAIVLVRKMGKRSQSAATEAVGEHVEMKDEE